MTPAGIIAKPSPARIRNALLGGKDNLGRDREAAAALLAVNPDAAAMAVHGRLFCNRAVRYAAERGIRQVIDVRCGLPVPPVTVLDGRRVRLLNAHEAARAVIPDATCAYADDDPLVVAHVRALLCRDGVAMAAADPFDPAAVLSSPDLAAVTDLGEPCCLVLGMAAEYMPPDRAAEAVAGYVDALAPGSLAAVCVMQVTAATWEKTSAAYPAARIWNHDPGTVETFFAGLELVPPGLRDARTWRPGWGHGCGVPQGNHVLAGMGVKR